MKIKIEKTSTFNAEVEVELPHYRKNTCHTYKVYSEHSCVQVCNTGFSPSISVCYAGLAWNDTNGKYPSVECTEQEYNDELELVSNLLKSK